MDAPKFVESAARERETCWPPQPPAAPVRSPPLRVDQALLSCVDDRLSQRRNQFGAALKQLQLPPGPGQTESDTLLAAAQLNRALGKTEEALVYLRRALALAPLFVPAKMACLEAEKKGII